MTLSISDIPELAGEIAEALKPLIDRRVEQRIGERTLAERQKRRSRDDLIMEACRVVGEASDRLALVRYTRDEPAARKDLEKAAAQLARVMRGGRP